MITKTHKAGEKIVGNINGQKSSFQSQKRASSNPTGADSIRSATKQPDLVDSFLDLIIAVRERISSAWAWMSRR